MNTVLIKEVNNQPVIFNVDNATDEARLKALQAVKMAKATAAEIFGDNIKYADNTTCTITDNPNNQKFPYTVVFDSSKIPSKPKRELGAMVGIGMPSENVIEYAMPANKEYKFTAPANGYVFLSGTISTLTGVLTIKSSQGVTSIGRSTIHGTGNTNFSTWLPVHKDNLVSCYIGSYSENKPIVKNVFLKFIYAQGENV